MERKGKHFVQKLPTEVIIMSYFKSLMTFANLRVPLVNGGQLQTGGCGNAVMVVGS